MEGHSWLNYSLIRCIYGQSVLFEVEPDAKAKVTVYIQVLVLRLYKLPGSLVSRANGLAHAKALQQLLMSFVSKLVSFFLLIFWVHKQRPTSHRRHISILSTDVYVHSSIVERLIVTLVLELMHSDVVAGLNHDRGCKLQKVYIYSLILGLELVHGLRIFE